MIYVDEREFVYFSKRLNAWTNHRLPPIVAIDVTSDKNMVRDELRVPRNVPTVQQIMAREGLPRHTDKQKQRLKEAKAFHKEYGQCLNNSSTKNELIKILSENFHKVDFNLVPITKLNC